MSRNAKVVLDKAVYGYDREYDYLLPDEMPAKEEIGRASCRERV